MDKGRHAWGKRYAWIFLAIPLVKFLLVICGEYKCSLKVSFTYLSEARSHHNWYKTWRKPSIAFEFYSRVYLSDISSVLWSTKYLAGLNKTQTIENNLDISKHIEASVELVKTNDLFFQLPPMLILVWFNVLVLPFFFAWYILSKVRNQKYQKFYLTKHNTHVSKRTVPAISMKSL